LGRTLWAKEHAREFSGPEMRESGLLRNETMSGVVEVESILGREGRVGDSRKKWRETRQRVFMDSFVCSVLESRFKPESSGKP
jgi:hypothetical protein